MVEKGDNDRRDAEGWRSRVTFSDGGEFAYRPGEVLVAADDADEAERVLRRRAGGEGLRRDRKRRGSYVMFQGVDDPVGAVTELSLVRIGAQPNHVLFSHCLCCGPHPAAAWANPFSANPFSANPFSANPFSANPFSANPFSANPFSANPFSANPFSANPFSANPFSANPFSANQTGRRHHSARPATAPVLPRPQGDPHQRAAPSIVVVDTGIARRSLFPHALTGVEGYRTTGWPPEEAPDEDRDDLIDPVAGHGTFIAGIIERVAPGRRLRVHGLLTGYGDASEDDVAAVLEALATAKDGRPDLVNLSFGGYALVEMARLAEAIRRLQDAGTIVVASAGNDATCRPAYPAAFPDVVAVGALGPCGPAFFTNYGPWVRASAPGIDVVSTFFTKWQSPRVASERYAEWVRWSGTSFSAPAVVGALARAMGEGLTGSEAVELLIDDPGLFRLPGLGAVVNQVPWWRWT